MRTLPNISTADNSFPYGLFPVDRDGIVPPDEFTSPAGDEIQIPLPASVL